MYCYRHPKVETNLRCGKCEKPICPKCAVQTPVGARCPDCAKLTRLPVFQVSTVGYFKAAGAGLVSAVILGVVWGLLASYLTGFAYLLALPAGYVIGELMSRAVNRKRGLILQVMAADSMAACYLIMLAFEFHISVYGLIALGVGIFLAVSRFR